MKKPVKVIMMIALAMCMGNAVAQVTVRQISLEWEVTADLEGDALYNNLCASCHGVNGKGDGPASSAIEKAVPDLSMLAVNNNGVYSRRAVERAIRGSSRDIAHGSIDMPDWEQQFMYVNQAWNTFTREAYARKRIHALNDHVETLQLDEQTGQVVALKP